MGRVAVLNLVKKSRKRVIAGVALVFLTIFVLLAAGLLGKVLVITGLFLLAVLPTFYKFYTRIPIGLEFMLFSTVIVGVNFGAFIGALFGAAAICFSDLMTRMIGEWSVVNMLGMGLGGMVAGLIGPGTHIVITGLITLFVVELVRQGPPILLGGQREKVISFAYIAVHLVFNLWLFTKIAPLFGL